MTNDPREDMFWEMVENQMNKLSNIFDHYGACNHCDHKLCCKINLPVIRSRDVHGIAEFLKMSDEKFIEKYLIEYIIEFPGGRKESDYVLNQLPCPFIDKNDNCSIYPVRPFICRSYPFESNFESVSLDGVFVCPTATLIGSEVWMYDKYLESKFSKMEKYRRRMQARRMMEEFEKGDTSHAILDPLDGIYKDLNVSDIVSQGRRDIYPWNMFIGFLKKKKIDDLLK